jgi:hypothetical protein
MTNRGRAMTHKVDEARLCSLNTRHSPLATEVLIGNSAIRNRRNRLRIINLQFFNRHSNGS